MLTLAQAKELTQSKLTQDIIDEFRKSALLDMLEFDNTVIPQGQGDAQTMSYTYNRVTTLPTASVRAIGSEYTPQETVTTKCTVDLKILGGSFQIDRVVAQHEKKVVDQVRFQLNKKAEAARALFHDLFVNGDSGVTAEEFDGIDKVLTGSTTEVTPTSAIDLSTSTNITSNWQVFLDNLRAVRAKMTAAPTIYLMNSEMYGKFQSIMDRAGINLASKTNYGEEVTQWGSALIMALGDKPGTSNPIIETTAGVTSIYSVRLAMDAVHGISPDGDTLVKQYVPDMTAPGAVKLGEVELVAALAIKASKAAGVLRNIKIA